MARAPKPGVGKRAEAAKAAKTIMKLKVRDGDYTLTPYNLPFAIKARVRKATGGLPFSSYWAGESAIDDDSIQLCVWVARMCAGEEGLQLAEVVDAWPDDLTAEDFDVELIEPDAVDLGEETDPQS